MGFFADAHKQLDEAKQWLEEDGHTNDAKREAGEIADNVLDAAAQMGGKIPGDIDDTLIKKAREIKAMIAQLK